MSEQFNPRQLAIQLLRKGGDIHVSADTSISDEDGMRNFDRLQAVVAEAYYAGRSSVHIEKHDPDSTTISKDRLAKLVEKANMLRMMDIRFVDDNGMVRPRFACVPRPCTQFGQAFQLLDAKHDQWLGYAHEKWETAMDQRFPFIEAALVADGTLNTGTMAVVQAAPAVSQDAPVEVPDEAAQARAEADYLPDGSRDYTRGDGGIYYGAQLLIQPPLSAFAQVTMENCAGVQNKTMPAKLRNYLVTSCPSEVHTCAELCEQGYMKWFEPEGEPGTTVYELTALGMYVVRTFLAPHGARIKEAPGVNINSLARG